MPAGLVVGLVVCALALGAALRWLILQSDLGAIEADEAVVGLMASRLLHGGEVSVFYWEQTYGGSLEPYLSVPLLAVLGHERIALSLTSVALAGVSVWITWRWARLYLPAFQAACCGLALWLAPGPFLWWSLKARGFYWITLVLGVTVLYAAEQVARDADGARASNGFPKWAAVAGVAAGVAWWSSPQALFFLVPAGILVLVRRALSVRAVLVAAGAFAVGAWPWLVYNVVHPLDSVLATSGQNASVAETTRLLFSQAIPRGLGFANTAPALERAGPFVAIAIAAALAWGALREHRRVPFVATAGLVSAIAIWGWIPAYGTIGEGRYLLPVLPFLLLAGFSLSNRVVAVGLLVVCLGTGCVFAWQWRDLQQVAVDAPVPPQFEELAAELLEDPDACINANYWIAYPVAFLSSDRLAVSSMSFTRNPDDDEACRARPRQRYVYVTGTRLTDPPAGVAPSPVVEVGPFVIVG